MASLSGAQVRDASDAVRIAAVAAAMAAEAYLTNRAPHHELARAVGDWRIAQDTYQRLADDVYGAVGSHG